MRIIHTQHLLLSLSVHYSEDTFLQTVVEGTDFGALLTGACAIVRGHWLCVPVGLYVCVSVCALSHGVFFYFFKFISR